MFGTVQFYHPPYLYFLFLLVIPIIVHLFQLRKFKKQRFTNVAFLRRVQIQARKSSQIKKWLILLTRLLALACLVIAFAQPFIPNDKAALQPEETVIYLDNSYSMQMPGSRGSLMKGAVQQLLEEVPAQQKLTLFTNNQVFKDVRFDQIKNDLLQLHYTPENLSFKTAKIKASQFFSDAGGTRENFIALSDFQEFNVKGTPEKFPFTTFAVQLQPENLGNISIDSLSIQTQSGSVEMEIFLSSIQKITEQVPVSAYEGKNLIAKSSAVFKQSNQAKLTFNLEETQIKNGRLTLTDEGLQFDNQFYFNLAPSPQLKVVAISGAPDNFLAKIFSDKDEFSYQNFKAGQVDYNVLEQADFIILNELKNLPPGLPNLLEEHRRDGGTMAIIPSKNSDLEELNSLLAQLQAPRLGKKQKFDLKISEINFTHPLFEGVFSSKVENFQYPEVQSYYSMEGKKSCVLQYNNTDCFLHGNKGVFLFSAALNKENSNFKRSPLVVPVFYKMARKSLKAPDSYFILGEKNTFDVRAQLSEDQVLHLKNKTGDFIPRQQKFNTKVSVTTGKIPEKAGNYRLTYQEKTVKNLSFNYNRQENQLDYVDVKTRENLKVKENIQVLFQELKSKNQIDELWKWFVIFAALFFVTELLLLKFLK